MSSLPILYSFRRCPYAMRARMALHHNHIKFELREVDLKNKPLELQQLSAKSTVPVLVLENNVIDESLDIMLWAIQNNSACDWFPSNNQQEILNLIELNDESFKTQLDFYKYADRFPKQSQLFYRQQATHFLNTLELNLSKTNYLVSNQLTLADIALFPFIRQFAFVDINWFKSADFPFLQNWLFQQIDSILFQAVMKKHRPWEKGDTTVIL